MTEFANVLLRSSAEIFIRTDRIRRYFRESSLINPSEHEHFTRTVCGSLDAIEDSAIRAIEQYLSDSTSGDIVLAESSLNNLRTELAKFSEYFSKIHEVLVYLPRPPVPKEAAFCLEQSFGATYHIFRPTIILGSVFNVLTYDFFLKIKDRIPDLAQLMPTQPTNIFIELPICDRSSPLSWPILAHELGHSIDKKLGLSDSIVDNLIKKRDLFEYEPTRRWCREITADFIATKALGPSTLLSLFGLDLCFLPRIPQLLNAEAHRTHPPTRWRLRAHLEFFKHEGCGKFIREAKEHLDRAFDLELQRLGKREVIERVKSIDDDVYNKLIEEPAKQILEKIENLQLPGFSIEENSLIRFIDRLNKSLPISAQGEDKSLLRKELEKYMKKRESGMLEDNLERATEFSKLTEKFKEQPSDLASVFVAGLSVKETIIDTYISEPGNFASKKMIKKMCDELWRLDELVISSIRSMSVHHDLLSRMGN